MKRSKQGLPPPVFCPACQSAVEIKDGQCWYCQYDLHGHRVCPYCRQAVPADEDPCHHCGRPIIWSPGDHAR